MDAENKYLCRLVVYEQQFVAADCPHICQLPSIIIYCEPIKSYIVTVHN